MYGPCGVLARESHIQLGYVYTVGDHVRIVCHVCTDNSRLSIAQVCVT